MNIISYRIAVSSYSCTSNVTQTQLELGVSYTSIVNKTCMDGMVPMILSFDVKETCESGWKRVLTDKQGHHENYYKKT